MGESGPALLVITFACVYMYVHMTGTHNYLVVNGLKVCECVSLMRTE